MKTSTQTNCAIHTKRIVIMSTLQRNSLERSRIDAAMDVVFMFWIEGCAEPWYFGSVWVVA